ncbi:hypothetical protein EDB92DRAFT_1818151 [Lactarius akahatsu]|uniref:Uncharacterized protein n=1 Tax=Lactarius akahatsu TaxID=416441 RepID=A0AAD4LAQ3_9AGAM|nr:hypothetical protein EDB92DRAFT_1818151 [Lactarius akahatsu]
MSGRALCGDICVGLYWAYSVPHRIASSLCALDGLRHRSFGYETRFTYMARVARAYEIGKDTVSGISARSSALNYVAFTARSPSGEPSRHGNTSPPAALPHILRTTMNFGIVARAISPTAHLVGCATIATSGLLGVYLFVSPSGYGGGEENVGLKVDYNQLATTRSTGTARLWRRSSIMRVQKTVREHPRATQLMDRRTSFEMVTLEPQHGDNGLRRQYEREIVAEVSKTRPIFEMRRKRTITSLIMGGMKRGDSAAQLTPVWLPVNKLAEEERVRTSEASGVNRGMETNGKRVELA